MLKRTISWATTSVLGLILLAPVLALLPAAVLDIGPRPESRTRFSVFPLALAALDPLIWTSLWNSVAAAVIVAVGSLVIGVALGGVVARFRFWGRPVLSASITAPAVVAPALFALGLLGLFDPSGPRGLGSVVDWIVRANGYSARMWPWLVWVWAALIQGVALVVLTTRSAYGRLQPFGQDAARLAGARPPRVWWTLTWPTLRPSVVSAVYLVFMINLADPAAPLVLGLRRTLGFQMVATALGPDPFPRLAAIALIVLAITLAGRSLVWWRGRSLFDADIAPGDDRDSHDRQTQIAAWPRSRVVLDPRLLDAACLGASEGTDADRAGADGISGQCSSTGQAGDCRSAAAVDDRPRTPAAGSFRAAGLGSGGVALPAGLAAVARSGCWCHGSRMAQRRRFPGRARASAGCRRGSSGPGTDRHAVLAILRSQSRLDGAGLWMERIGLAFDPFVFPELVLFVGACLAFLPRRLAIRPEPPGRDDASARRVDQIRIAGAGRGPAVWHVWRWAQAIPLPTMVLWGMLVATAITPALVLAPTLESRPIGPGIVVLIDQPDDARAQASALALAAIALDLLALGWASARVGRAGDLAAADLA